MSSSKSNLEKIHSMILSWRDEDKDAISVASEILEWHEAKIQEHIRQENTSANAPRKVHCLSDLEEEAGCKPDGNELS